MLGIVKKWWTYGKMLGIVKDFGSGQQRPHCQWWTYGKMLGIVKGSLVVDNKDYIVSDGHMVRC